MTKEKNENKNVNQDRNSLSMYLNEIICIPLLSREEEEKIARQAAAGNKAAREKLVNANLRFVVKLAKKYQGRGLPLEDLISEGNIGLLNAVDRFDVEKGWRFISYAVWWIRQAITNALWDKARMIRLPQNKNKELIQIEHAKNFIREQRSKEDEIKEIGSLLNMEEDHIRELLNISDEMLSLEKPVSAEGNKSLGDYIEDTQYETPDSKMMEKVLQDEISKVLTTLDKKEADIIRYRYGLDHRPVMSLKNLGERFDLTKERIRQIEQKAMVKLQDHSRAAVLKTFIA